MTKYTVLLTNDDGMRSPTLVPFLDALRKREWCGDARIVVPAEEHSWIAQAATRMRPLRAAAHEFGTHRGYTVSGTPADCVSIGIDNLYGSRPEFVFSGINIGTNTGLAFYLSSGTVGGARQAFLCGVKAAAFSVRVPREIVSAWVRAELKVLEAHQEDWRRIAGVCAQLADRLVQHKDWEPVDFFSINVPWQAGLDTPAAITRLERRFYGPMFEQLPDGTFLHSFQGFREDHENLPPENPELEGDITALARGAISVTPIRYTLDVAGAQNIEVLRRTFE